MRLAAIRRASDHATAALPDVSAAQGAVAPASPAVVPADFGLLIAALDRAVERRRDLPPGTSDS